MNEYCFTIESVILFDQVLCVGPLMDRTWWSGVDDEKVKEGKRLIFPGLVSRFSRSRESARNRDVERQRERERERKIRGPKL